MVVVGRMFYQDLAGTLYSTDYCFSTLANGVTQGCPYLNDAK
jgi:hypothetical protein